MGSARAILEQLNVTIRNYDCRAYINGDQLERMHCSSRAVFVVDDEHVVKVDFGTAFNSQSWREWWYWNHHVKDSDHAEWVAATHGCSVDRIKRPDDMGGGPYDLFVSTTVQDHIRNSGVLKRGSGRYAYDSAVKRLAKAYPGINDLYRYQREVKERQFVYCDQRKHYVLVDYGMHVHNGTADAHMGMHAANMQVGERIYAKSEVEPAE